MANNYIQSNDSNLKPFISNSVFASGPLSVTYTNKYTYGPTAIAVTQTYGPSFHTNSVLAVQKTGYQVGGVDIGAGKSPKLILDSGATSTTNLAVPSSVSGMYVIGWGGGGGGGGGGYEPGNPAFAPGQDGRGGNGGGSGAMFGYYQNINASGTLSYSVGGGGGGGIGAGLPGVIENPNGNPGGNGGSTTVNFVNTANANGGNGGGGGRDGSGGPASSGGTVNSFPAPVAYGYRANGAAATPTGGSQAGGTGASHNAFNLWNPTFPLPVGYGVFGAGGSGGPGDTSGSGNGFTGSPGTDGRLLIWFYYDNVVR